MTVSQAFIPTQFNPNFPSAWGICLAKLCFPAEVGVAKWRCGNKLLSLCLPDGYNRNHQDTKAKRHAAKWREGDDMAGKLRLRDKVVAYLKSNADKKFTAREIADWILATYPAECEEKRRKSAQQNMDDVALRDQIRAEIGSNRPGMQKKASADKNHRRTSTQILLFNADR